MNALSILLLGPVELWVGERQATLGGPNQRALLALLALDPGRSVSRDRLTEALWGNSPPDGHTQRLHTAMSRLRAAMRDAGGPPDAVESTETGYRLRVEPSQVDAVRADLALRLARELRSEGRLAEALAVARGAVELWRAPALADIRDNGWAGDDLRRLEDLKLSLSEEEFGCRLQLRASPELVEALRSACVEAPLRERLHAQLMLALDAVGRRTEALHEYDRVRRRLAEELGIGPGAVLREAHEAVLRDAAAPWARAPGSPPETVRRGRRPMAITALIVAAIAITASVVLAGGPRRESGSLRLPAGELVLASPDPLRARAEIPLSGTVINEQPSGLVIAGRSLWSVTEQGTVTQVDLARGRIVGSTPLALPAGPGGMAVGMGAAWVTDSGSANLYRLDSGISAARRIPLPPLASRSVRITGGIAVVAGSVWVVRQAAQTVDRLSPEGRLEHRFRIPDANQLVGDARGVWVISPQMGVVTEVDPATNVVRARTRLRPPVCCLALGGGSAWATSETSGLLWQLRRGGAVEDVIHIPAPATEVAYANGAVWISGYTHSTITRVDAGTMDVRTFGTDQPVAGMAAGPGVVAFATLTSQRSALAGVRGPVARIVMPENFPGDADPAVGALYGDSDADRQHLAATCLSLYEYRHGQLAPYAAAGPAVRTSDDRVWTFRVRSGFRFSPPSGESIDAGTFAATIERSTSPVLDRDPAGGALVDVEGMGAYRRGLSSHLAGVEARGDRLTIRLRRPVRDLDARLAAAYFCAVPKGTPAIPTGLQGPLPSAGPYYDAALSGGAFLVLRRNPYYPLPHRAGFDAFVYDFNVDPRTALARLRHGQADYAAFYGADPGRGPAARLGAAGDGTGIRFRLSPRPPGNSAPRRRSSIGEFFGPRVGCTSYSPLYAGVELKRLCPAARGG